MSSITKKRVIVSELTGLVLLYGIIIWVLVPNVLKSIASFIIYTALLSFAAFYYLYVSPLFIHRDALSTRGLGSKSSLFIRTDNFSEACWVFFGPLLIMGGVVTLAAWYKNSNFLFELDWGGLSTKFLLYIASATIQDTLFFSFIFIRLKDLFTLDVVYYHKLTVAFLFALLFALVHLPNIPLMTLTFIFAFWLSYLFYDTPNLHVIIIIHATIGTLLHRVYELHMKIGYFYGDESQQANLIRFLFPAIDELIGKRW